MTKEEFILKEFLDSKNDGLTLKEFKKKVESEFIPEETRAKLAEFGFSLSTGFEGTWQFKGENNFAEYNVKQGKLNILPGYSITRLKSITCTPEEIISRCNSEFNFPEHKIVVVQEEEYNYLKACEVSLGAFMDPRGICPRCGKAIILRGFVCPSCGYDDGSVEDGEE